MDLIQLTSIISAIPLFYPFRKLFRKEDLNLFDLLIVFSAINFCISPLFYSDLINEELDNGCVFTTFLIISTLEYGLLYIDYRWTNQHSYSENIINITRHLNKIEDVKISIWGYGILVIALYFIITVYVPYTTVTIQLEDQGLQADDYGFKTYLAILSMVLIVSATIIFANFTVKYKRKELKIWDIALAIAILGSAILLRRRDFVFLCLIFFILFYSICRIKINKKFVILVTLISSFLYFIYFPFFNVIRRSGVDFDTSKPIESFINVISYGLDNYEKQKENAQKSTSQRTLGLYYATYSLVKASPPIEAGNITMMEIDVAIPKIINPNKGIGSEHYIGFNLTGLNTDIADSILLESTADFGILGGLYAIILYIIVFYLYSKYEKYLHSKIGLYAMSVYITISALNICWRTEGKLSGTLSWFITSVFILLVLFILKRTKAIDIQRN